MHVLPDVAKQPNLELKTRPKQHLGSLPLVIALPGYTHKDRTRASTLCCFGLFFSSFENAKNLLIKGPNITKNCSLKCDFLIFNYQYYCQNLVFVVKTPNLFKKLFLCYVSKPKVGPTNSQHNNFKWGNISAGICTLVLFLRLHQTREVLRVVRAELSTLS
jgi:hypothetical protein